MEITYVLVFEDELSARRALIDYLVAAREGRAFHGLKTIAPNRLLHGPWRPYRISQQALVLGVEVNGMIQFNADDRLKILEFLMFDLNIDRVMELLTDLKVLPQPVDEPQPLISFKEALPALRQMALKAEQLVTVAEPAAR